MPVTTGPLIQDDGRFVCHDCGDSYERIGYHWARSDCTYPAIAGDVYDLIRGAMLSNGSLQTDRSLPYIRLYMANESLLSWFDDQCEWLTTGVKLYRETDNSHANIYTCRTRSMPQFTRFDDWYRDDGTKVVPPGFNFGPIEAKMWYACSGSLHWDRRYPNARPYVTIGTPDAGTSPGRIRRAFRRSTFGSDPTVDGSSVRFGVDESARFLDWIGSPVPGVRYKWATDSIEQYDSRYTESGP